MSLQTQKDELEKLNISHIVHIAAYIPVIDTHFLYTEFLALYVSHIERHNAIEKYEQALKNLFHIVYLKISIVYMFLDVDRDDSTVLAEFINIISNDFNRDVANILSIEVERTEDLSRDMVTHIEELITSDELKVLEDILLGPSNLKINDIHTIVPKYVLHRDDRNGDRAFAKLSLVYMSTVDGYYMEHLTLTVKTLEFMNIYKKYTEIIQYNNITFDEEVSTDMDSVKDMVLKYYVRLVILRSSYFLVDVLVDMKLRQYKKKFKASMEDYNVDMLTDDSFITLLPMGIKYLSDIVEDSVDYNDVNNIKSEIVKCRYANNIVNITTSNITQGDFDHRGREKDLIVSAKVYSLPK